MELVTIDPQSELWTVIIERYRYVMFYATSNSSDKCHIAYVPDAAVISGELLVCCDYPSCESLYKATGIPVVYVCEHFSDYTAIANIIKELKRLYPAAEITYAGVYKWSNERVGDAYAARISHAAGVKAAMPSFYVPDLEKDLAKCQKGSFLFSRDYCGYTFDDLYVRKGTQAVKDALNLKKAVDVEGKTDAELERCFELLYMPPKRFLPVGFARFMYDHKRFAALLCSLLLLVPVLLLCSGLALWKMCLIAAVVAGNVRVDGNFFKWSYIKKGERVKFEQSDRKLGLGRGRSGVLTGEISRWFMYEVEYDGKREYFRMSEIFPFGKPKEFSKRELKKLKKLGMGISDTRGRVQ